MSVGRVQVQVQRRGEAGLLSERAGGGSAQWVRRARRVYLARPL